jgi:hypothetical protein
MSLGYILTEFAKEAGVSINTTADRTLAISKINKAARELYQTEDLVGSLREQVFDIDPSKLQMTLPYYVEQVRGVRNYDTKARIKSEDMRPRYFYGKDWPQAFLTWRKKNQIPIARELESEGPLTISIPQAESERFKVYVRGSTSAADAVVETVIFEIGETEKTTTKTFTQFPGITLIGKDKIITQNVSVEDVNGNEIAEIANCELESRYTLIALSDTQTSDTCDCYEILYKYRFSPFYNDYDNFPAPDYDDAIVYKAVSQSYSKSTDPAIQAKVMEYELKCSTILKNRAFDGEGSDEKEIQFGRNGYLGIMGGGYPTGFSTHDIPNRIL